MADALIVLVTVTLLVMGTVTNIAMWLLLITVWRRLLWEDD